MNTREARDAVRLFKRKIKNPIMGTAQIISCGTPGNPRATRSTCVLFVVVEGPGLVPASHEVRKQVLVQRWPHPGMTLPCRIDQRNPSQFEIDFEAIPDWRDEARQQATQAAASRATERGGVRTAASTHSGANPVTVVGAASPGDAEQAIQRAEQALGIDLNGDGTVG